jgi:hypothetical protein
LPWDREIAPGSSYWRSGLVIASLLFAGQIIYFEGTAFCRNPAFRPSLEKICGQLNCQLPAYQNPAELSILQGSLSALPDRSQQFSAAISNRAAFAQPYPNLKLTMLDYAGNPFARRIFRPQDYLPEMLAATSAMLPDASTAISLNIAAPKIPVGGYTFELIY